MKERAKDAVNHITGDEIKNPHNTESETYRTRRIRALIHPCSITAGVFLCNAIKFYLAQK
jgi:hypothetical protein